MSGQNYYSLAAQTSGSHLPSTDSPGIDLYRATFNDLAVTYDWSDKAQSLSDILNEYTLPLVVKLCNDNTVKDQESPINLQQPLLLYREVKGRKLHARSMQSSPALREADQVIYNTTGPYLTFPDQYPGLFKDVDTKDHHLLTIADVTRIMPKSFLSQKALNGLLSISQLEGELFQKTTLAPGLYRPSNILEDAVTYISKRKSQKKKFSRWLRCEDERGKHVLLPLESSGVFYIAELSTTLTKTSKAVNASCRVHRWTELDHRRIRGMRVRLMQGQPPHQECQFTGLLELSHVTEEHTVVVSTMASQPRLFEMAVTSEPFFTVARNSKNLECSELYQRCLKFSRLECDEYVGRAKVKQDYGIDQVVSQT